MGCGCGKKRNTRKISTSKKSQTKKTGTKIRKKRLTKLISSPGRVSAPSKK